MVKIKIFASLRNFRDHINKGKFYDWYCVNCDENPDKYYSDKYYTDKYYCPKCHKRLVKREWDGKVNPMRHISKEEFKRITGGKDEDLS